MIDIKKMDEKDFVFVKKRLSEKEERAFTEFLKSRKKGRKKRTSSKKIVTNK